VEATVQSLPPAVSPTVTLRRSGQSGRVRPLLQVLVEEQDPER
jgi:hypothetical protein